MSKQGSRLHRKRATPVSAPRHSMIVPKTSYSDVSITEALDDGAPPMRMRGSDLPELLCPFETGQNPLAEAAQCGSIDWAERVGLIDSATQRNKLDKAKIAWLEAMVFRSASLECLQLAADWTTLFCLLDDHVELDNVGPVDLAAHFSKCLAAFRGRTGAADDPIGRALVDLRERMLQLSGENWVLRFGRQLDEVFGAFLWEELNRWKRIRPSLDAYRTMRCLTVGLRPQFLLGEIADDIALSDTVRAHPDIVRLEFYTCRAVGWANDLFTFPKELKQGEPHNLVLVLMDVESLSLEAAIQRAGAAHDEEVRAFLAVEARLPRFNGEEESVIRYITMLRHWIAGHLDWARKTDRYSPPSQAYLTSN